MLSIPTRPTETAIECHVRAHTCFFHMCRGHQCGIGSVQPELYFFSLLLRVCLLLPFLVRFVFHPLINLLPCQDLHRILGVQIARPTPHRRACNKVLKHLEALVQVPGCNHSLRQHRHRHPCSHQQQLQERIPLTDFCRPDLRTRQAKVPIPRHGLGRREADPTVVEGCKGERDVAAEDDDGEPGRDDVLDGERDHRDGHEGLIGHWVDDGADDGLLVETPRDVAVEAVGDSGIGEEGEGVDGLAGKDEVADQRSRGKTGEGEDVGDGPNVFVGASKEFGGYWRWDGGWFGGFG